VIVGSGSSGAVLANRLSDDPDTTVVLLEAGPADKNKFAHIPAAFSKLFRTEVDWDYLTEPQPELKHRQIYWPRGKMFGGSSSMNAMMWVRGFRADYDEWALLAGEEWGFAAAVEQYRRIENVEDAQYPDEGAAGPLHISRQRSPRASTAAYLAAVQEAGFAVEPPNRPQPDGFSETMVTQRDGRRWSTADAYLRPVLRRPNLTIRPDALAARVLFQRDPAGPPRAVGVEYVQGGIAHTVAARREVILCGGATNSPQLLMLSGIGDKDELAQQGIEVVHHAPEVGANLQDHLVSGIGYGVATDSLFDAEKPRQLLDYLIRHRGMLTSNVGEAYGFVRSRSDLDLPDLEMIFAPAPFYYEGLQDPTEHGVILATVLLRPHSRGRITLASGDPAANPVIDPRYLSDSAGADRAAIMSGLRICAELAAAPAMKAVLGQLIYPPQSPKDMEATLELALNGYSHTMYHPVGTCRMGTDETSVVTPRLEVRGVQGLRVADASVMPLLIRGHTHAPSVFVGEQAAKFISARRPRGGGRSR
jgi:choline dehydrogenase-like flavoprotein